MVFGIDDIIVAGIGIAATAGSTAASLAARNAQLKAQQKAALLEKQNGGKKFSSSGNGIPVAVLIGGSLITLFLIYKD